MKRMIKIVMLTAMLAVVLLSMTGCGKTRLDLTEGMVVTFRGADGNGRADLDFPENDGTPNYVNTVLKSGKVDATDVMAWIALDNAITYSIEPSSNLSNGDTVTVTISVKEAALENLGFTAKPYEETFKVEGLTEVIEVDAFENFEITFSGTSPAASADFPARQEIGGTTVYYSCERNGNLKAGEEFTVTAWVEDREYYKVKEETRTFVVDNVDKYLTCAAELQPDMLERLKAKGDAVVGERVAGWGYFTYHGYEYVGYEFWGMPESSGYGNVNCVYLYYRINCNDGVNDFPTYYYVSFDNVIQYADGTQEADLKYYQTPSFMLYETLREYQTLESRTEETACVYGSIYVIESFF